MIEGGLRNILERRKMNKQVAQLKEHYIVCGYGRIGKVICQILKENKRPFVVIEKDEEEIRSIEAEGFFALQGEASDDEMLITAGIKEALGLIAVVSTDAEAVFSRKPNWKASCLKSPLNPSKSVWDRPGQRNTEHQFGCRISIAKSRTSLGPMRSH